MQPCDENVRRIGRGSFDDFRTLYKPDEQTYWNSDRIYEKIEEWTIFVTYEDTVPVGAIYFRGDKKQQEIFGVCFLDEKYNPHILKRMLAASLNYCKNIGIEYMTFFCNEDSILVLKELGFRCIGQYILYTKEI